MLPGDSPTSWPLQASSPRQHIQLPRIFSGDATPNLVRGGHVKQRMIAHRSGVPSSLPPVVQTTDADDAAVRACFPPGGKRIFANAPTTQSVVDTVVFNRDIDFSGETQFDEDFMSMFQGAAGAASAAQHRKESKKVYPKPPMGQSDVDKVVFGRDLDMSEDSRFNGELMQIFDGSAGRPTAGNKIK